jgi:hypothetical protein
MRSENMRSRIRIKRKIWMKSRIRHSGSFGPTRARMIPKRRVDFLVEKEASPCLQEDEIKEANSQGWWFINEKITTTTTSGPIRS